MQVASEFLKTILSSDEDMLCAFGFVAAASVAVWGVQQVIYGPSGSRANNGADSSPAAKAKRFAARTATLQSYEQSSRTSEEVTKLMESPEFKSYWAKNGERILHRNERAFQSPYYYILLLAFATFATLACVPFQKKVVAKDTGVVSYHEVHLIASIDVLGSATKFFGEVPVKTWLTSCQAWCEATPFITLAVLLVGMLTDSSVGDLLCASAAFTLLATTETLNFSVGFALLVSIIVIRLMR